MHKETLDMMLANACPQHRFKNGDVLFVLDLHCNEMWIRAKLISTYQSIQYEIVDWKLGYDNKTEYFLEEDEENGYWNGDIWHKVERS